MSRRSTRNAAASAEGVGLPAVQAHILPSISTTSAASSGLYLQNHYNHPANNRLYLGPNLSHSSAKGHHSSIAGAVPKAPKPPEKPLMPYMRYSRKVWDEVKENNPNLKLWEIGKIIGQMWRELPSADKQQFVEEYEVEKMEHLDLMKSYHNSPCYQSYLHAKTRAEALEASAESMGAEKDDAYMSIEPVDENIDDDAEFSVKHVAAARFQRNHRLINDILGESVHVPNMRAVVTTQRLNVLKNQVQSLQLHQKKLEAELRQIEESHDSKKRKWKEQAQSFVEETKRLCSMTPQEYYKEYKLKQQQQAALLQQQKLQQQQAAAAAEEQSKAAEEAAESSEKKTEDSVEESSKNVEDDPSAPTSQEETTSETKGQESGEEVVADPASGEKEADEPAVDTPEETPDAQDNGIPAPATSEEKQDKAGADEEESMDASSSQDANPEKTEEEKGVHQQIVTEDALITENSDTKQDDK